jgi:hypothetical protein
MEIVSVLFYAVLALAGVAFLGCLIAAYLLMTPVHGSIDKARMNVIHAPGQAARQAIDELAEAYVYEELQRAMDRDEKYVDMVRSVNEQLRR